MKNKIGMRIISQFIISSFLVFSSLISQSSSISSNHDVLFKDKKSLCHGQQLLSDKTSVKCDKADIDWENYAIHFYRRQGHGRGAAGGGADLRRQPVTHKNHAPWLLHPCLVTTSSFAFVTFALLFLRP
ncbi:uncharacterized protein LOC104901451 isoform X2 [Beta vulgaris subsp. vulgaris]|uniref:uncharacterized protein LOC104901451 isoform X2 n=1 Tax=Beta vulgaris subsp. vulgaris TaxID=3555 RepID=UPI00053FF0C0|nr:uncharacterized protein LOC104901451 isoform X2 [Beta vulgaris subsp. vulgaris]